MEKLDTTPSSPTVIRTYKKEAELEIWKMKSNGEYALLKTYPMCRWSGQLGPKKREGDMQVPEGFYSIAPGQMNPNSHYYLAFNVGYPNAYDRAYGRTGGNVMVHGVCSSAGCFSMTDEQVADIYAIARDSFRGGQREIQLQSYPFHMTAENMAKFRLDPNIDFWKNLKNGSDHFEVTKNEPSVLVCGKHYVFDATTNGRGFRQRTVPRAQARRVTSRRWLRKRRKRTTPRSTNSSLPASSPCASFTLTADKIRSSSGYKDESDPEALATPPQEIVLNDRAKPAPAAVKIATADAEKKRAASVASTPVEAAAAQPAPTAIAVASAPANPSGGMFGGLTGGAKNVQKWLHLGGQEPAPPPVERRCVRFRSADSRRAAAAAPRRRASGVAAYAADPAGAAKPRRDSNRRARCAENDADVRSIATGQPARPTRGPTPISPERRETRRAASSASASARVGTTIGPPSRGHT